VFRHSATELDCPIFLARGSSSSAILSDSSRRPRCSNARCRVRSCWARYQGGASDPPDCSLKRPSAAASLNRKKWKFTTDRAPNARERQTKKNTRRLQSPIRIQTRLLGWYQSPRPIFQIKPAWSSFCRRSCSPGSLGLAPHCNNPLYSSHFLAWTKSLRRSATAHGRFRPRCSIRGCRF
jgi:hypothetical protein